MRPAAEPIGFLLLACSAVAFDPCVDPDPKLIAGTFPEGFAWATATAAFQIEGGWNASDKGPSTWDVFNHQKPSPVVGGATGDVACDSYHRWRSDIALLRGMKLRHYRLSLSWPRLLPNGLVSGGVSKAGVKYYRDLLRGLKAAGIAPLMTLFHWDLPMHLHELGGFRSPAFPGWFRDYAELCFALFGRYVKTWITFNEPTIIVGDPAGDPLRRPCPEPGTCEYLEAHQLLLAHGEAARLFRARFRPYHGGRIGMALSCGGQLPKTLAAKDSEASDRAYHFDYGWFAGPMLQGDYPAVMRRVVGQRSSAEGRAASRLPVFTAAQRALLNGSADFLGLNHYTSTVVSDKPNDPARQHPPSVAADRQTGGEKCPNWPRSGSTWLRSAPWGIRHNLNWIKRTYGDVPVIVTENGWSDNNGSTHDPYRSTFYRLYINNVLKAVLKDGVNVVGYTAWSLMDNLEWLRGYSEKFGLHRVDFDDPDRRRTPKESAAFFAGIAQRNGFPNGENLL